MNGEREEGGGRILLGDNTGGRAVMLRQIMFLRVTGWISV
jgi:hypothetical protein